MIVTWSEGEPDHCMAEALVVGLREEIRTHPWWRARARLTIALLDWEGLAPPARILDAGCGWGVTLEALEREGYRADGLDISRRALEAVDRPLRRLFVADLTQPLKAPDEPYDAVLALDVIEHLDDDQAAVKRLGGLVRPGGLVVVSVPARPDLYSEFDAIQGHRSRYTPESLRATFAATDLVIDRFLWWGEWMVPVLKRQRQRSHASTGESALVTYRRYLKLPPWPLANLLRVAFALDHDRTLRGKNHTGTSLFALAHRPVR
jgi:SAM-dependent methyltransferase